VEGESKAPDKVCNACASPIDPRARLCAVCKTWQSWWRNWLPYWGGIIAVASLAASAATFAYTHLRRAPGPVVSIAVLDLANPGRISVLNTGNVDVLITHVAFNCVRVCGVMETQPVAQTVKSGEVLTVPFSESKNGDGVYIDPSQWKSLMKANTKTHYSIFYYSENDPGLWPRTGLRFGHSLGRALSIPASRLLEL